MASATPTIGYEGVKPTVGPGTAPASGSEPLVLSGAPATAGNTAGGDVVIVNAPGSGTGRAGTLVLPLGTTDPAVADGMWNAGGVVVPSGSAGVPYSFSIVCSAESGAISTSTAMTFRMPHAVVLSDVRAAVKTAPSDTDVICDIKNGGTSIFDTNLLQIDKNTSTSVGSKAAYKFATTGATVADDAAMAISVTQSGSIAVGLKLNFIGHTTTK